jgi:hypothetical protein
MFASFDPVALDQACADACNRQPVMPNSQLSDHLAAGECHHDHFSDTAPAPIGRLRFVTPKSSASARAGMN